MLGADYSTKFSPWLAHGNVSPRSIHAQIEKYGQQRTSNKSTYWVVFELLWRDYFRWIPVLDQGLAISNHQMSLLRADSSSASTAIVCFTSVLLPLAHVNLKFLFVVSGMPSAGMVSQIRGCSGSRMMQSCCNAGRRDSQACRWSTPTCANCTRQVCFVVKILAALKIYAKICTIHRLHVQPRPPERGVLLSIGPGCGLAQGRRVV